MSSSDRATKMAIAFSLKRLIVPSALVALWLATASCARTSPPASSNLSPSREICAVAPGEKAPGFTLPSAAGGTVSLSDYAGKPVLLYFSMGPG